MLETSIATCFRFDSSKIFLTSLHAPNFFNFYSFDKEDFFACSPAKIFNAAFTFSFFFFFARANDLRQNSQKVPAIELAFGAFQTTFLNTSYAFVKSPLKVPILSDTLILHELPDGATNSYSLSLCVTYYSKLFGVDKRQTIISIVTTRQKEGVSKSPKNKFFCFRPMAINSNYVFLTILTFRTAGDPLGVSDFEIIFAINEAFKISLDVSPDFGLASQFDFNFGK